MDSCTEYYQFFSLGHTRNTGRLQCSTDSKNVLTAVKDHPQDERRMSMRRALQMIRAADVL